MKPTIKFPTLENREICIDHEDAMCIAYESITVNSILTCKIEEGDYGDQRFGGKAIEFAIEYCKKFGKIKADYLQQSEFKSDTTDIFDFCSLESSPEFKMKCKEADVEAWVDHFICQITENGQGMVYELLAVSEFLSAFRLSNFLCQYIFDYLTFKHSGEFDKIFGISILCQPYDRSRPNLLYVFEDLLYLPTLKDIDETFNAEFPFTPDELDTAELENKSVRIGGNLEYNSESRLVKGILIKIEYLVRRLRSLSSLINWMENAFTERYTECYPLYEKFLANKSNNGILELYSTFDEHARRFRVGISSLEKTAVEEIANLSTSYQLSQDINLISDVIDKIDLEIAMAANEHKEKMEEQAKILPKKLKKDDPLHRKDKILPHLTYFMENRYHEIYCLLFTVRPWTSPQEVQGNFRKLNARHKIELKYSGDQNVGQYVDVKNEKQNEDHYVGVESEERKEDSNEDVETEEGVSTKSVADGKNMDVVSSLTTLRQYAVIILGELSSTYYCFLTLLEITRHLLHFDLLLKDEEILTFICKEKLKLYMPASKERTRRSKISYAKEFDRIVDKTNKKFGGRGPVIEEAKKKYFQHFKKFCDAMDDETKRQKELHSKYGKGSRKRKQKGT